jgi:hypothetical protein
MSGNDKPPSNNTMGNISNNQGIITQGQIGNNTINQAPKPDLRFGAQAVKKNADGTYTETLFVEIESPYPPAQLYLQANGLNIVSFEAVPQRVGMSMGGPEAVRKDFAFVTLIQPFGTYLLKVVVKAQTPISLDWKFD